MASSNNESTLKEEAIMEKVSINVDVEPTAPIEACDGVSADNDAENIDDAGTGAAKINSAGRASSHRVDAKQTNQNRKK